MSGVQSIERAFALLRTLAVGPAGVTQLAERVGLPKSTVARLLSALETESAVEQVELGGEYRLGAGLADLASAIAPGRNLIAAARPHLVALMEETGESSGLAVLEDDEVLYLDHVESGEEVQVRDWTGERVAPHLVPSGLVLLAGATAECVDQYLDGPLDATTPKSVTEPDDIRQRLLDVERDGHAWILTEFDDGINSVAAPIRDPAGRIIAAVHVHGPAYRFPRPDDPTAITEQVVNAAARLSAQLR